MNPDFIAKTTEELNKIGAPVKQFNALVVNHIEKLTQFQLTTAQSYAELGLGQLRSALEIADAKGLQDYVSGQSKLAESVGKKLAADAEALAALNKEFATTVQKLAQESVTKLVPAAGAKGSRKSA